MLERDALDRFWEWKGMASNHALLVTGARQVGKSFLVKEFAALAYEHVVYFDFVEDRAARDAFASATSAEDLFFRISVYAREELVPGRTAIVFDEVQDCPEVITYVKYLVLRGDYDYILTGSLLGVQLENIRSFPVGYVTEVKMYPLSFSEFCRACGVSKDVLGVVENCVSTLAPVPDVLHERLLSLFHRFLLVGGMPDSVNAYLETGAIDLPRTVQADIRRQYVTDITKYAPKERRLVIGSIYDRIPSQLSQQNRRFMLSSVENVKRFDQVRDDFLWLEGAGVALPAYNVARPSYPLEINDRRKLLKLYSSDVGLLSGAFLKRDVGDILDGVVKSSLGGVYENFVAQELHAQGYQLRYFTKKGLGEIDLVIERRDGSIVALEIKSGRGYRTHAAIDNALRVDGYHIDQAFVLAECNVDRDETLVYLPIYAASLV